MEKLDHRDHAVNAASQARVVRKDPVERKDFAVGRVPMVLPGLLGHLDHRDILVTRDTVMVRAVVDMTIMI